MLHVICACETTLSRALLACAAEQKVNTVLVTPAYLLEAIYTLSPERLMLDGNAVRRVLFLHGAQFSLEPFFEAAELSFAEAEMRAFFSAIHSLPSVICFNGLDAVQWFSRPGLEYFTPHEIEVARYGGRFWLPFRGVQPSALVDLPESAFPVARLASNAVTSTPFICGKCLDGKPLPTSIATRLAEIGVDFGWLLFTADATPIAVSPVLDDPSLTDIRSAAEILLDAIMKSAQE